MRICSFLPAATEALFAVGLGDEVCGVTHECDYPADAHGKPVLVRPRIQAATSFEIDRQVSEQVSQGASLYTVDAAALAQIQPDLIVTQDLCQVCAVSPNDLSSVLAGLPKPPQVICFSPHTLEEVWQGMRDIGRACGKAAEASAWLESAEQRIAKVRSAVQGLPRPRVVCLEWLDPLYVAGHWMPEMIGIAGGEDVLGRAGHHSERVEWQQIAAAQPDVVLVAPCGFSLPAAVVEFEVTTRPAVWNDLPAVRSGRVYALDANAYTSRSGPRLVDGIEILAAIFHKGSIRNALPENAYSQVK